MKILDILKRSGYCVTVCRMDHILITPLSGSLSIKEAFGFRQPSEGMRIFRSSCTTITLSVLQVIFIEPWFGPHKRLLLLIIRHRKSGIMFSDLQ